MIMLRLIREFVNPWMLGAGLFMLLWVQTAMSADRGIYINQGTAENTSYLTSLINQSKSVGINTFVIDLTRAGPTYAANIKRVKQAGLKYVARIVVFPDGGTPDKLKSKAYWKTKYDLMEKALNLGADEIQLDYIRYSSKQRASDQNARDVLEVIKYFKQGARGKPLQIDVFGETAFKPSRHIGQDLRVFAPHVDALCPMVYPSHYHPFAQHSAQPYKTIHSSFQALKNQFNHKVPVKVYAWIELYNYHYKWSWAHRMNYIKEQLKAVKDSNIDGWYAWSPGNEYKILFETLRSGQPLRASQ